MMNNIACSLLYCTAFIILNTYVYIIIYIATRHPIVGDVLQSYGFYY